MSIAMRKTWWLAAMVFVVAASVKGQPPYKANALNLPLFNNGHCIKASMYYGFHGGMGCDAAYSLDQRIRVAMNLYLDQQKYSEKTVIFNDVKNYSTHTRYGELGIGYRCGRVDSTSTVIEAYGGCGIGQLYQKEYFSLLADTPTEKKGDYGRIFLQINAGYTRASYELGVGGRLAYLYYPKYLDVNYDNQSTTVPGKVVTEYQHVSFLNIEPAVQASVGAPWCRLIGQMGWSICLKPYSASRGNEIAYIHESFSVGGFFYSIGLQCSFDLAPKGTGK